jgi:hypothetical protein
LDKEFVNKIKIEQNAQLEDIQNRIKKIREKNKGTRFGYNSSRMKYKKQFEELTKKKEQINKMVRVQSAVINDGLKLCCMYIYTCICLYVYGLNKRISTICCYFSFTNIFFISLYDSLFQVGMFSLQK